MVMAVRRLTFIMISLLLFAVVFAQHKKIDSIMSQLKTVLPDTTRAMSMMRLAYYYETVDTIQSVRAYQEAINFAKGKNLVYETGNIYFNRSFLFHAAGKYGEALLSLDTAMIYLDKSTHPNTAFKKAQVYGQLANEYNELNDYGKSIEYHFKCNALYEKLNKPASLLIQLGNTSVLYKEMLDYRKQEEYARKMLALARVTNVKADFFKGYTYIGYALTEQNKYPESMRYLDSAKQYYSNEEMLESLISFHLVRGELFFGLSKLDSSFREFKKAYDLGKENMYVYSQYQAQLQMGNVLRKQKKFREAEKELIEAYEVIKKTGELAQYNVALQFLSSLYEDWGDTKKGLEYYKEFKKVSDSIVSVKNKGLAASLEKKYETEKKENTIRLQGVKLMNRRNLNYIFGGAAAALLVISLLSYRDYRQKQKIQQQRINELETEKKLSATEAVLKGEEQERTRLAKDLHDGLSGMLSGVKYSLQDMKGNLIMTEENQHTFERSMDMLDSSIKEMRRVAHNMMPEVLVRYGLDAALKDYIAEINKTAIIKVIYQSMGMEGKKLEQSPAIALYRIVQELLNNIIKHAQASEALVQVFGENGKLVVNVEDNGKGFDTKLSEEKGGMGWKNIRSRVELLKGTVDVQSAPGKGTSVNLELNIV